MNEGKKPRRSSTKKKNAKTKNVMAPTDADPEMLSQNSEDDGPCEKQEPLLFGLKDPSKFPP